MNLKITLLLFFYFIVNTILYSQLSVKIVNEDFSMNKMRWEEKSNNFSEMKLTDGKYLISCKKESTAITSTIEVPHLQFTDYRITASLSKLKGIDDNGFGIVWGAKNENNELEFVISGNGQFKVMKWEGGTKTDLVKWTYSSSINKWDFSKNTLKIESSEKVLRYYINDNYVAVTNDIPQLGNRVGFVLNETMQVEVDNLLVENLAPSFGTKNGNADNVKISSANLSGSKTTNELFYNETASINIELVNISNETVKDFSINLEPNEFLSNIEYNSKTMIAEIPPKGTKNVSIKLSADENVSDNNYSINIKLSNINGNTVDNEVITLKTVGLSSYYSNNKTKKEENTNPYYNNTVNDKPKQTSNSSNDACAKGCSGAGFLALITGLILAIL